MARKEHTDALESTRTFMASLYAGLVVVYFTSDVSPNIDSGDVMFMVLAWGSLYLIWKLTSWSIGGKTPLWWKFYKTHLSSSNTTSDEVPESRYSYLAGLFNQRE